MGERHRQRVRHLPLHAIEPGMGFRSVEHGRVQIGSGDRDLRRQSPRERACHDTRARRHFENPAGPRAA